MRIVCLLCLCLMAFWVGGCGGDDDSTPPDPGRIVGTIPAEQLWSDLGSATKPTIIDVRGPTAYSLCHLPGSANDCGCLVAAARAAVRQNLVIVGETAEQAVLAAPRVLEPGEEAHVLEGGMSAWPYGLDISGAQLALWLNTSRDLDVIDVRTPSEWEAGHLPQSVNHPLADLTIWAEVLDPAREIVLVCGSGMRSATARDQLIQRGFTKVHNLAGGLAAME